MTGVQISYGASQNDFVPRREPLPKDKLSEAQWFAILTRAVLPPEGTMGPQGTTTGQARPRREANGCYLLLLGDVVAAALVLAMLMRSDVLPTISLSSSLGWSL